MSTNGPTNRASEDATSASVTTGAVSKMGIGLRRTLQTTDNADRELVSGCYAFACEMRWDHGGLGLGSDAAQEVEFRRLGPSQKRTGSNRQEREKSTHVTLIQHTPLMYKKRKEGTLETPT